MKYDHKQIESKWREVWEKSNPAKAEDFSDKPKKYILAEFPYPSGEGLHVGHIMRYTLPDVYSRKLRMSGYNVMYPMGWDAFGLPAENYAVKTGVHPEITTKKSIATFKRQLQEMGFGFDWDREVATTDPKYYKWTQWIFLKFWEKGLAELKEEPVWWCEDLKTVLANEEVIKNEQGELVSERGEKPVERRMLKQWVLKIPAYADKLIDGLKNLDFPDSIKNAQINWIGRSDGALVKFQIRVPGSGGREGAKLEAKVQRQESDASHELEVFTTAHDTIFGATFMVIAPEHELFENQKTKIKNQKEVFDYIQQASQKSELDRQANKKKTGVLIDGLVAVNPMNGEEIPVFVADYVLGSYGTGAVMGVPGHDERDLEFAERYSLPIIFVESSDKFVSYSEVIKNDLGKFTLANSGKYDGQTFAVARAAMLEEMIQMGIAEAKVEYKLRDWLFSRQRYWGEPIPLIHREDGTVEAICDVNDPESVAANLPLLLPEVPDYTPSSDASSPLARNEEWVKTTDSEGKPALRETNTMPNWAGSCWYYMRYIDPHNDEAFADMDKLKYWLPVDRYFGGSEHTTLHLLYSRFWHQFLFDEGEVPTPEPYAWRLNTGVLLGPDGHRMSKSRGNVINPDEVVKSHGADALRLYINFMGPLDATVTWQEGGLKACRRLVEDIWKLKEKVTDKPSSDKLTAAYHNLVKKVGQMIDELKSNTSVSEIMIFVNEAKKEDNLNKDIWEGFLRAIAPFTVFLAEELWSQAGHKDSVHLQSWPEFDESKLVDDTIAIAVQVNGKLRDTLMLPVDTADADVIAQAKASERVQNFLAGQPIKKEIYVKGRVVNLVV